MKNMNTAKKAAYLGIMGALALTLSFLEGSLIPDIPFLPPGAKPGLSNIVTMLAAELFGFVPAMYITVLKGLFALAMRGATASMMSLSGGILSTVAVVFLLKFEGRFFSLLGISVAGAVLHNAGQLLCSCCLTGTAALLNYGKYLLLFAIVSGCVTGTVLNAVLPQVKKVIKNNTIQGLK